MSLNRQPSLAVVLDVLRSLRATGASTGDLDAVGRLAGGDAAAGWLAALDLGGIAEHLGQGDTGEGTTAWGSVSVTVEDIITKGGVGRTAFLIVGNADAGGVVAVLAGVLLFADALDAALADGNGLGGAGKEQAVAADSGHELILDGDGGDEADNGENGSEGELHFGMSGKVVLRILESEE